ncbi:unnamed protein product [Acanthoscelides obtectus]|uniref:Uncharacterized protein n=1 Tax=Acanthoscelides obtectus TaxID=200917 RepID=A0A9P0LYN2_ACAOB|nr:unnamed protein product [Acanthoscelides obtectus]CAK1641599.1 hypothetical protein AOBTE_LOCUS12500 [Acanthoscelides obtectus]
MYFLFYSLNPNRVHIWRTHVAEAFRPNAVGKCVRPNKRMCLPSREFGHWAVHQKKIEERIRLAVFSVYAFQFLSVSSWSFCFEFLFSDNGVD